MQSLLPNILEVAKKNKLEVNPKSLNKKEIRFKCPFCKQDSNRKDKFYLSVNESKNVFKCWYCKESGGVIRFISLLEGKSEQELIEEIRKENGSNYKKHPAEKLTQYQLDLIGYRKINWYEMRNKNYSGYKHLREKIWGEWKAYIRDRKRFSYQLLFTGLITGEFKKAIEQVKKIEKDLQVKLLDDLLKDLFEESKSEQTFQLECLTSELVGHTHPYETIDVKKTKSNIKNEKGEEFEMLNVCTFVGRLVKDVELRYTPNGKAVANFNLAITRAYPDQNGERQADFILCQAWGKVAENMANQLSKGDTIGIQSRVQTRSYKNQQGQRVYVTEFIVEGVPTFIKVKKWENGNSNNNGNVNNGNNRSYNTGQSRQTNQSTNYNDFFGGSPIDINDTDLPF